MTEEKGMRSDGDEKKTTKQELFVADAPCCQPTISNATEELPNSKRHYVSHALLLLSVNTHTHTVLKYSEVDHSRVIIIRTQSTNRTIGSSVCMPACQPSVNPAYSCILLIT